MHQTGIIGKKLFVRPGWSEESLVVNLQRLFRTGALSGEMLSDFTHSILTHLGLGWRVSNIVSIMNISSPAFQEGEAIPTQYSRNGDDKSPPLAFRDVPANAQSLALIVDDPDAPKGTFTHWTVFDIDPKTEEVGENQVPANAREGANDWKQPAYGGPQPPSGEHRYFFKLFALDTKLNLPRGARRREIQQAMEGHIIEQAQLIGRFSAEQSRLAGVR